MSYSNYGARSPEEQRRNLANLGPSWQQNPEPWPHRRDRGLELWRSREAYRLQTVLYLLGMVLVTVLLALVSGCATWFVESKPSVMRTRDVAEAPDVAFARATRTAMRMGIIFTQQDSRTRTLQGGDSRTSTMLSVSVEPSGKGSRLTVMHTPPATPFFLKGTPSTLSDEFLVLYSDPVSMR